MSLLRYSSHSSKNDPSKKTNPSKQSGQQCSQMPCQVRRKYGEIILKY